MVLLMVLAISHQQERLHFSCLRPGFGTLPGTIFATLWESWVCPGPITDDGGHYIAARFKGPTDAFNHVAQDTNLNRGQYRLLEDQWAREKRAGRNVTVKIVPSYDGASKRPAVINIWFTINGHEESVKLANEPKEKRHGK